MNLADTHRQIELLNSSKRDLCSQLGLMVKMSELQASKAEASKLREDNNKLGQDLLAVKGEVDNLKSKIQVKHSYDDKPIIVSCYNTWSSRAWYTNLSL